MLQFITGRRWSFSPLMCLKKGRNIVLIYLFSAYYVYFNYIVCVCVCTRACVCVDWGRAVTAPGTDKNGVIKNVQIM